MKRQRILTKNGESDFQRQEEKFKDYSVLIRQNLVIY